MQGYCINSGCQVFALAVSGFGSDFSTSQDAGFESDFVSWVTNANIANDGLHNPVRSFFWNGWDPSSYGRLSPWPDQLQRFFTRTSRLEAAPLPPKMPSFKIELILLRRIPRDKREMVLEDKSHRKFPTYR